MGSKLEKGMFAPGAEDCGWEKAGARHAEKLRKKSWAAQRKNGQIGRSPKGSAITDRERLILERKEHKSTARTRRSKRARSGKGIPSLAASVILTKTGRLRRYKREKNLRGKGVAECSFAGGRVFRPEAQSQISGKTVVTQR